MKIEEHYPLEKYNSFRLPVKTRWFIEYENEEELVRILRDEYFRACNSIVIGSGSNLLFLGDYNGIILHSAIKGIALTEETGETVRLRIGAAEVWDDVVAYAVDRQWYGIENLSGIPGECGGTAVQNIGAYGAEIKNVIEAVEAYNQHTCEKQVFSQEECRYAYRQSRFKEEGKDPYIITHIRIRLSKTPQFALHYGDMKEQLTARYPEVTLANVRRTILAIRREKLPDPDKFGNAGSFFMNPLVSVRQWEALREKYPAIPSFPAGQGRVKIPAAWLIEQCGFKGRSLGEAGVYAKQALVLINLGRADGQDIALLAEAIREAVARRFDIELMPEVKYIGS
ncbi:MAG: UDP-N-acetylmuramate dehydrogenase [Tannerellaceae bacterium]|jgi:UDP-N-acetylmuramate dehydrogenase|nr:UDP-N-acetylmuramate dehydrogenase [Tannerellaceae bacterium]